MNLVNELGNEIAFAFLVEKKRSEKVPVENVGAFIDKVKEILESNTDITKQKTVKASAKKV